MRQSRHISSSGFSIVEVIMALGILSVIVLGAASAIIQLTQQQQGVVSRDASDNFSAAFLQHLFRNETCSAAVASTPLPPAGTELDFVVPGFRGAGEDAPQIVGANTQVGPNTFVRRLFVRQKPGVPQGTEVMIFNQILRRYNLQVILQLERRLPDQPPTPLQERVIEVPVLTNTGNLMQSCYTESSSESICSATGGTVDPATGRCMPATQCEILGTYVQSTCSDGGACSPEYNGPSRLNSITGTTSCPPNSCPTQSGRFTIQRSEQTGKKSWRTYTVTETFYICMRCTGVTCPAAPAPPAPAKK